MNLLILPIRNRLKMCVSFVLYKCLSVYYTHNTTIVIVDFHYESYLILPKSCSLNKITCAQCLKALIQQGAGDGEVRKLNIIKFYCKVHS